MTGLTMGGFISYENQRGNGGKDKRYCDVLSSFKPERVNPIHLLPPLPCRSGKFRL